MAKRSVPRVTQGKATRGPNSRSRWEQERDRRVLVKAAQEYAQAAFRDTFNQIFELAASLNPRGSSRRTVDLFLAAMRAELESREHSWAEEAQS